MKDITPQDLHHCIEVLESIVQDRTCLTTMAAKDRLALLIAAGRVSRPTRHEVIRTAKAFRRVTRKADQNQDRAARASTEIRTARLAEVFSPPPQLVSGGPPRG